jgi:hypothetical protein
MEHAGVLISIASKWAGQYDAAFTQRTYVHGNTEDLSQGSKAPARILKIALSSSGTRATERFR